MTAVPWATKHWRVIAGCTKKSRGCAHCFAAHLAATRLKHHPAYKGLAEIRRNVGGSGNNKLQWTGEVRCFPDQLAEPLRRRKPTTYFVGEMGDLFHEKVSFGFIAAVFGVMAASWQHTFLLLTKRPERMAAWFRWAIKQAAAHPLLGRSRAAYSRGKHSADEWRMWQMLSVFARRLVRANALYHYGGSWPLPNVWPGVSAEGQKELDERAWELLRVPVHEQAGHWLSLEPQLEHAEINFAKGYCPTHDSGSGFCHGGCPDDRNFRAVIQGCESGPNRRLFDIEWAISMHQQCQDAGVDYYLKQVPGAAGKIDKKPQLNGRTWRALPWAK